MTAMKFKKGDEVIVIANTNNHGFDIGEVVVISAVPRTTSGSIKNYTAMASDGARYTIREKDIEPAYKTRAEEADALDEKAKTLAATAKKLKERARRLRTYANDEEELAATIAEVMKTEGNVAAITKLIVEYKKHQD